MKKYLIVILIVLVLAGVGYYASHMQVPAQSSVPSPSASATPSVSPITFSQLLNTKIPDFVAEDDKLAFTLSNGHYESGNIVIDVDKTDTSYAVSDQTIAAVFAENTGGTGTFYYLAVFVNDNGIPKYVTSIALGDRITVKKVSFGDDGMIAVNMITQGPGEPLCCGTLKVTNVYRFDGTAIFEQKNK